MMNVVSNSWAAGVIGPGCPNNALIFSWSCSVLSFASLPRYGIGFLYLSLRIGMLYPRLASIASFWLSAMCWMNSLAAGMFFENFQIAQTFGSPTFHLSPAGPATSGMQNVSAKTLGFVIRVEWNAEIASWIQEPTPEARNRLSEASSQEKTSGVMPSS